MPIRWHRRDIRPADNVGLASAAEAASTADAAADDAIVPLFVLDDALLVHAGPPRVAFLLDALRSLRAWYRERDSDLLVIRGDPRSVVPDLATALDAGLVTWNRDYSAIAAFERARGEDWPDRLPDDPTTSCRAGTVNALTRVAGAMDGADDRAGRILLLECPEPPAAGDGRALAGALADAGFDVERDTTVDDCLRALAADGEPAGIVVEHAPPAIDGLRLLRSVRVSHPSLPVVLLPRERDASIAGEAVAAGASGYASPAEDAGTVVERLRSCLERDDRGGRPGDERYRNLVEIAPVPINLFDAEGVCVWGNDAVLDLLGLDDRADLVGRSIFEFVHPDDRETARLELETVIESSESVGPTRMKLAPAETGDVRHVRVATAVGDLLGADVGQAIVIDETDRELRQRHLTVLDTWLRHNIRNELNVVLGLAEAVAEGRTDDARATAGEIRESAAHIVGQADRQRRLIHLLKSPPDPVSIDLGQLLERRVDHARETLSDGAGIRLEAAEPVAVEAVPELEGAVGELLENAVEHAEIADPTVVCSVARRADEAVLRIRDEGPGIPAAERDLLSLDREVDQINHGSGLGLVFVYWAVQLSDGTLSFDVTDEGTTVSVGLPVADGE